MMAEVKRWVIVGECGLYVGQEQTRESMIARHVSQLFSETDGFPRLSEFAWGGLNAYQRRAWELCKRRGDRCQRVNIPYEPRPRPQPRRSQ
jgi:hypothetical protein